MSCYQSEKVMQEWADTALRHYLDAEHYPLLFAALRAPKRSKRLSRVDLGVLRYLLTEKRPDRARDEQRTEDAILNGVTREEIAETVRCHPSSINRAVRRLNKLVRDGAHAGSFARRHGLVLFHDRGYCFQPALGDMIRARSFSSKQLESQAGAHTNNIALADDKQGERVAAAEQRARFEALTPLERERVLAAVGA